jgi:hypothetical protein
MTLAFYRPKTAQNPKKCLLFQNLACCGTVPLVLKCLLTLNVKNHAKPQLAEAVAAGGPVEAVPGQ